MPPHNDDWKIEEFDRRTVALLDILSSKVEKLESFNEGLRVKVAFFGSIFAIAGTVGTHYVLKLLHL